jgi:hypothetical protein
MNCSAIFIKSRSQGPEVMPEELNSSKDRTFSGVIAYYVCLEVEYAYMPAVFGEIWR